MNDEITGGSGGPFRWYDLFSRGARDWLRHSEKVREAVRQRLPEIISNAEVLGGGHRPVRVPMKLLEHYRFRLRTPESHTAAGQGNASPGDVLRAPEDQVSGQDKGQGTTEPGDVQFVLELAIDDIVDWLWEELELPNLQARVGGMTDEESHAKAGTAAARDQARPPPLHEGSRQATPRAGRVSDSFFRRRFTLPTAGSPGNTHNSGCCVLRHGRVRSMSVEDRQLAKTSSSGSCRACAASTSIWRQCSWHTRSMRGSSRNRSSFRYREREARSPRARSRRLSSSWTRATIQNGTTSTCSMHPTERTPLRIERLPPQRWAESVRSPASWDTWRSRRAPARAARRDRSALPRSGLIGRRRQLCADGSRGSMGRDPRVPHRP